MHRILSASGIIIINVLQLQIIDQVNKSISQNERNFQDSRISGIQSTDAGWKRCV